MSLRSWALAALGVGTVVCAALGYRVLGGGLFAVGLVGYLAWGRLRYQLALRRIAEARRTFDARALRREVDSFARYANELSPLLQELQLERGVSWMMEERFEEAEAALREVDPARLSPRSRLAWMGNMAFCHVHWGPDQLGADVLASHHEVTLVGLECEAYDLKLIDHEGDECVVHDIDLCLQDAHWHLTDGELASCTGFHK